MSPSDNQKTGYDPCESGLCESNNGFTYFCAQCDCSFCPQCWSTQPAHRPNKKPHEQTDRVLVEKYRRILEPSSDDQEKYDSHKLDEDTTWFGIARNQNDESTFEDYGRFVELMAEGDSGPHKLRYPRLVSFIGQTGAGKSTLVKILIESRNNHNSLTDGNPFPSPVAGSVNDNVPVSADVHLYADPESFSTNSEVFYADCEGLEGGESAPKSETSIMQHITYNMKRQRDNLPEPQLQKRSYWKGYRASRKLTWATNNKEKSKREYAVTELYPRLLYTFSDVVVFVLRNTKTFESAVLRKLIEWASTSFESSIGQPALPHLIIALNATELTIDPSQWDVSQATNKVLSDLEKAFERVPALQDHVEIWRAYGREIRTTEDLLKCYYSSITIVRIPAKGRYMLMDEQIMKLKEEISIKSYQSHCTKRRVRMLSNSDDLQLYLQFAFDHFTKSLDVPFDFVKTALQINPIPLDFGGNIVKLAVAFKDCSNFKNVFKIFEHISLMVASCIWLDIHRCRRLGTPEELFSKYYGDYCEQAFNEFCDRHWPCKYRGIGNPCVNVAIGHAKGHQDHTGRILAMGEYVPSYSYNKDLNSWMQLLEHHIRDMQQSKNRATVGRSDPPADQYTFNLHQTNMQKFYRQIGSARQFTSHSTCFCCLKGDPVHPLLCGHILCDACVRLFGKAKGRDSIEMADCPMEGSESYWLQPCVIRFMPRLAGARVLCLDGGGARGIVELEVLKAIEENLPLKIPIRNFFDLIVGTSTGGINSIGIGVEGWSIDECIHHFTALCKTAFTPRGIKYMPMSKHFAAFGHKYSRYKTKPLEQILKSKFSVADQPLFGSHLAYSSPLLKVAVTSTKETSHQAVLLTNYNRSHSKLARSEYEFERGENPQTELKIWEALRATSAAPSYFKPLKNARNGQGYLDGAIYYNNPVQVADSERRLIWPETKAFAPDILLSIGTGCNKKIRQDADSASTFQEQTINLRDRGLVAAELMKSGVLKRNLGSSQIRNYFNLAKDRVESLLDPEIAWLNFHSMVSNSGEESRYFRINPDIGAEPPKLDDVDKISYLSEKMHQMKKEDRFQLQARAIARRLVASCFYVDIPMWARPQDLNMTVVILCKFLSDSQEIRHLGEYLKDVTTKDFEPYFSITEVGSSLPPTKIVMDHDTIRKMIFNASFDIKPRRIAISSELALSMISLSIHHGEELQISGFPRSLVERRVHKALSSSNADATKRQKSDLSLRLSTSDEGGQEDGEYISTNYPEYQELPEIIKLAIFDFLQERTSDAAKSGEILDPRIALLADEVAVSDDVENLRKRFQSNPKTTILHVACSIGDSWLVELQIKSGVDIYATDCNEWTPYMIAYVKSHWACEDLLWEQMKSAGKFPNWDALTMSKFFVPTKSIVVEPDKLTITAKNLLAQAVKYYPTRHPASPLKTVFYFEIAIINLPRNGIIKLGLSGFQPELEFSRIYLSNKCIYDGDNGKKLRDVQGDQKLSGLRYSDPFGKDDVVGCLLLRHKAKLFFTLNGVNQGVAFCNVGGVLYPIIYMNENGTKVKANFGDEPFRYNIEDDPLIKTELATA